MVMVLGGWYGGETNSVPLRQALALRTRLMIVTRASAFTMSSTKPAKAILERPPLDATCSSDLLHAERILGMLQAIPECWQELRRHATPQFLENSFGDGWPACVRHHSSPRR